MTTTFNEQSRQKKLLEMRHTVLEARARLAAAELEMFKARSALDYYLREYPSEAVQ